MKCTIIESPLKGDYERNKKYARAAMLDSLMRAEAPLVSHLLYTQVLDDTKEDERTIGIVAGIEWYRRADACIVYGDLGISDGMKKGIARAESYGVPVEYRYLGLAWDK